MFSASIGIMCLIFFIKYLKLRKPISENVNQKCEQEIKKNLKADEYFETFDEDMLKPAFGVHAYIGGVVTVAGSGVAFIYRCIVLFTISLVSLTYINIRKKTNLFIIWRKYVKNYCITSKKNEYKYRI